MSVALSEPDRYFSREEYRRWYDSQPNGRFERVDGRIVRMASERSEHVWVKAAVWLALRRAVAEAGLACEAWPDGLTVRVGDNDYEPDALVNCGESIVPGSIYAPNPVIIVEVLSPGAMSNDTGAKLADYFQLACVAHYLIVHPRRHMIIHHARAASAIDTRIVTEGSIAMTPPGISITVEEVYGAS